MEEVTSTMGCQGQDLKRWGRVGCGSGQSRWEVRMEEGVENKR